MLVRDLASMRTVDITSTLGVSLALTFACPLPYRSDYPGHTLYYDTGGVPRCAGCGERIYEDLGERGGIDFATITDVIIEEEPW